MKSFLWFLAFVVVNVRISVVFFWLNASWCAVRDGSKCMLYDINDRQQWLLCSEKAVLHWGYSCKSVSRLDYRPMPRSELMYCWTFERIYGLICFIYSSAYHMDIGGTQIIIWLTNNSPPIAIWSFVLSVSNCTIQLQWLNHIARTLKAKGTTCSPSFTLWCISI